MLTPQPFAPPVTLCHFFGNLLLNSATIRHWCQKHAVSWSCFFCFFRRHQKPRIELVIFHWNSLFQIFATKRSTAVFLHYSKSCWNTTHQPNSASHCLRDFQRRSFKCKGNETFTKRSCVMCDWFAKWLHQAACTGVWLIRKWLHETACTGGCCILYISLWFQAAFFHMKETQLRFLPPKLVLWWQISWICVPGVGCVCAYYCLARHRFPDALTQRTLLYRQSCKHATPVL